MRPPDCEHQSVGNLLQFYPVLAYTRSNPGRQQHLPLISGKCELPAAILPNESQSVETHSVRQH